MKIVNYPGDLQSLRHKIHGSFEHRPDALMELLDALTSNPNARSVAERINRLTFVVSTAVYLTQ